VADNKRITVCGSFGFGNTGDEAITLAYTDILNAVGIDREIDILSRYKTTDIEKVIGTTQEERIDKIRKQPIIVSGGGIVENKDLATVLRCREFLSKQFTTNIGFIGISVEPGVDYGWNIKRKILKTLKQSTLPAIYTRDLFSEVILRRLYPELDIKTTGDLVLWLKADEYKPKDFPFDITDYIVISFSSCWNDDPQWYMWITKELVSLANDWEVSLLFVPMSSKFDDDRVEHRVVADMIIDKTKGKVNVVCMDGDYTGREVAAIYKDAKLVVSMRLHGCVIAYGQKTPFIGLSYHPKLVGFSYTVGLRRNILPVHTPRRQAKDRYGFKFKDLGLVAGELNQSAKLAIEDIDYSSLEYYKRESLKAVALFLAAIESEDGG